MANMEVASSALKDLIASNTRLLDSGEFSDLQITCGEHQYQVHRAIVCPRSKVLARMCQQGDGAFEEGVTGKIDLQSDDQVIVEKMLDFLYKLDFSDDDPLTLHVEQAVNTAPESASRGKKKKKFTKQDASNIFAPNIFGDNGDGLEDSGGSKGDFQPSTSTLPLIARMYTIAEKYDIKELKTLAQHKFERRIENNGWNNSGFSMAIQEVFGWTAQNDQGLRPVLVRVASENIHVLRDRGEFKEVLDSISDFTRSLLDTLMDPNFRRKNCSYCGSSRFNGSYCSGCGGSGY